jgi:hypothetical protein
MIASSKHKRAVESSKLTRCRQKKPWNSQHCHNSSCPKGRRLCLYYIYTPCQKKPVCRYRHNTAAPSWCHHL